MSEDAVGRAIAETIRNSAAVDLASEIAELALDTITESESLRQVPVFGFVRGIWDVGVAVRDALFLRKLGRFLNPLSGVTDEEREKFGRRIDEQPEFARRVGEQVLLLVDKLDDALKPLLLGRAFRAVVEGRVSFDEFLELAVAIDRCLLADFWAIKTTADYQSLSPPTAMRLQAAGILELVSLPSIRAHGTANQYNLTVLGRRVNELGLNDPRSVDLRQ